MRYKHLSDGEVNLRNLIGLEQCNKSHIASNFIFALSANMSWRKHSKIYGDYKNFSVKKYISLFITNLITELVLFMFQNIWFSKLCFLLPSDKLVIAWITVQYRIYFSRCIYSTRPTGSCNKYNSKNKSHIAL